MHWFSLFLFLTQELASPLCLLCATKLGGCLGVLLCDGPAVVIYLCGTCIVTGQKRSGSGHGVVRGEQVEDVFRSWL